jgi:diacylglycerol kinase (ATP)
VAFWLGQTGLERAVLVLTCFIVLITELLNSAIEAVVDRVGDEVHPLAGRAKDMGSAAVFLSLASVVMVWGLIAYQRFAS